jgi:hypothetical protein
LAKCHVPDQFAIELVSGMGRIENPRDLPHFIPLTGRESQLSQHGPAWIIQLAADVPQPGGGGVWTNPTCVVTADEAGFLATGPIRDGRTGIVATPEPPTNAPDRVVPPLLP